MKWHKQITFFLLIAIGSFAAQARVELSVTYEPYKADEVVMTVGKHKITAAQLKKYKLAVTRVTIKNEGAHEETFVCDKKCVPMNDVYKRLKYSEIKASGKGILFALGGYLLTGIIAIAWIIYRSPILLEETVSFAKQQAAKQDFSFQEAMDFNRKKFVSSAESVHCKDKEKWGVCLNCCFTYFDIVMVPALFAYPLYCTYTFNIELNKLLDQELLAREIIIDPGQTITKLLITDISQSTDLA